MRFYNISNSTGKETGLDYPQLNCTSQTHAHSLSAWHFPDSSPKLNFKLYETAKVTDVLSTVAIPANGFLVNNKVKDILNNANLMSYKFYDASVLLPKTGEILNYYWLHLCQPDLINYIDYKRSVFYETEWGFRENEINIDSYEHYKELKANDKTTKFGVVLDEIYVTEPFNKKLDIFTFLPFSQIFASEKMKDEFEKNKVTGLVFEETSKIKI